MKLCTKCGKPGKFRKGRDVCVVCSHAKYIAWRKKHPDYVRRSNLSRWKLTLEKFEEIKAEQNNSCLICGREFFETPAVDHDHKCCPSGKSCGKCIRGLLCRACNTGLGNFGDNLELLIKAAKYIRTHKWLRL